METKDRACQTNKISICHFRGITLESQGNIDLCIVVKKLLNKFKRKENLSYRAKINIYIYQQIKAHNSKMLSSYYGPWSNAQNSE